MNFIILMLYFFISFAVALLGLFIFFVLHVHYIHKTYEHLPGPPRSSFIFGHLLDVYQCRRDGGTLVEYHLKQRMEHGPIFVMFFIHRAFVFISDPVYVREILHDFSDGCKPKFFIDKLAYIFGQRLVGTSILTNPDDESWRKRRHLMNPAFHRKCLKDFVVDFNEVCDRFLTRMTTIVEETQETSMVKEFGKATLDVISQVSFNVKIGAIEDPDSLFARAIVAVLKGIQANVAHPFNATLLSLFQFRFFQSASQKEQIDAVKFVREFARECITNRINDIKANKDVPNDLLSLLVNDTSLSLTMDDIIDEFVLIFIAGQETTANSLAFVLYEIIQNPDIEGKILNELNNVLGNKENVDFGDLAKLKYLGQVLQEGLRKYPVVGGPLRVLKKEITVGGYRIPRGTAVCFEKYLFNHCPEIWPNPELFDPERFAEPEKIPNFNMVYFPFAIGPRNCIGQYFAKFESKIILARLLRKFQFQLCPGQTGAMEERLTMTPQDGVMCRVMLRSKSVNA